MTHFNYRLDVAYDGRGFEGFARQPTGRTIEGEITKALRELVPTLPGLSVGGRTDRGVSAVQQVISFHARTRLSASDVEAVVDAVAPGEIAFLDFTRVPRWFHAQFSGRWRRYAYWHERVEGLDVGRLDGMLGSLVGRRDFRAFSRSTPRGKSTSRKLVEARARLDGDQIRFDFKAESYLRRQVRLMVSTAIRETLAGADDNALVAIAETLDREATAYPAAPEGLWLVRIGY